MLFLNCSLRMRVQDVSLLAGVLKHYFLECKNYKTSFESQVVKNDLSISDSE